MQFMCHHESMYITKFIRNLFICSLFNNVATNRNYIAWNNLVAVNNCKGYGRKRSWPNLRHYPGIFLEGMKKITKKKSHNRQCPGRNPNQTYLE
jgi:hypothetical protein